MKREIRIGTLERRGLFLEVELTPERLSLSAFTRARIDSDINQGGQMQDTIRSAMEAGTLKYADGWNRRKVREVLDIWDRWHLNDMRAGCEHQRAEHWDERPIDPSKPLDTYGLHYPGQRQASWNMLAWVRPSEHPDGLLGKACEVCGYKYGSAWLSETVPDDVRAKVESW